MLYNYSSQEFSIKDLNELKNKANNGDGESLYLSANYYEDGLSIDNEIQFKPNQQKAFELTKLAFENGASDALIKYANYLTEGTFCDKDEVLAVKLYKIAIKNKDSIGAFNLS